MVIKSHPLKCETCTVKSCENNPNNLNAYYLHDRSEKRLYPFVEDIHEFTSEFGCASHSNAKPWDNRLIWAFEDLLTWLRKYHIDQMDIRDHVDLILGEYRNELEERQKRGEP